MTTNRNPIKFAYWVPNVSGGLFISSIEQRTSWNMWSAGPRTAL